MRPSASPWFTTASSRIFASCARRSRRRARCSRPRPIPRSCCTWSTICCSKGIEPVEAVKAALSQLRGAFALGFIFAGDDDLMIGARNGPPLAIGYGDGEMYLGSDAIALGPVHRHDQLSRGRRLGGADAQGRHHLRQEQRDRAARGGQALGLDLAGRQGELPPLHGQGNPRAAGSGRPHAGALRRHGDRARDAAGQAAVRLQGYPAHLDRRLRHRELCRLRRQILVRAVRAACRSRSMSPRNSATARRRCARAIWRSSFRSPARPPTRWPRCATPRRRACTRSPWSTCRPRRSRAKAKPCCRRWPAPKSASPRPRRSPAS